MDGAQDPTPQLSKARLVERKCRVHIETTEYSPDGGCVQRSVDFESLEQTVEIENGGSQEHEVPDHENEKNEETRCNMSVIQQFKNLKLIVALHKMFSGLNNMISTVWSYITNIF